MGKYLMTQACRFIAATCLLGGLTCTSVFYRYFPSVWSVHKKYFVSEDADLKKVRKRWNVVGKTSAPGILSVIALVSEMRAAFNTGCTLSIKSRRANLEALLSMVAENERVILDAVWEDLRRPSGETLYYDFLLVQSELRKLIKHIYRWTVPERVGAFSLLTFPSSQWIEKEPYGLVLIVGPFNYPFLLTSGVIAGAIAAGNNVILKPSTDAPISSRLLTDLLVRYVDPRLVSVVGPNIPGDGVDVMSALLAEKFDFIFFTGSTRVGSIIAQRAAENLTPCALELGGKNPVFVTQTSDISIAAKQCIWGRNLNSGQQCIAPEYVVCHESVLHQFTMELQHWIDVLIHKADAEGTSCRGREGGSTSGHRLLNRVTSFLGKVGTRGENFVCGDGSQSANGVEPTVVVCGWDSDLMVEEMFCPILCVIPYDDLRTAVAHVRTRPKPLSLYIFSTSRTEQRIILDNTTAGGVTINGVVYHAGHAALPFGGVGESGVGSYHGEHSITCFQNRKPVLQKWRGIGDQGLLTDPFFVYGPHKGIKLNLLRAVGMLS